MTVQIPSLVINNSYKNNGYIILPLNGKNRKTTEIVNTFFKTLDKEIVEHIKRSIAVLRKTNKISATDISYRAIVNELEGDDDEIYKNGLIRYRLDMPETVVYDDKKNVIPQNNYQNAFVKGVYVKSIIEISNISINTKTGNVVLNIKPLQLRVQDETIEKSELKAYSFYDDSEEDTDSEKNDFKESTFNTMTECVESEMPPKEQKKEIKTINLETKSEVKKPDIKSEAKKPDIKSEAKKPDIKSEAKKPDIRSEAKKPDIRSEAKPVQNVIEARSESDEIPDNVADSDDNMDDNEIQNYFDSIKS